MSPVRYLFTVIILLVAACSGKDDGNKKQNPSKPKPADAVAKAPPADAMALPDAAPPDPVGEFDAELALFYRVAACAGEAPLPKHISTNVVDAHCKQLGKIVDQYREKWLSEALPFFAKIAPADLPDVIIYPFGGEDLVSALAVLPEVRELTIISLEKAKDPRAINKISTEELVDSLKRIREHIDFLTDIAFHRTEDLELMAENPLSEQVVGATFALAAHARVPVSLRFFTIADTGTLEYTTKQFDNFEITFRKPGGPLQTYRHIATNLANRPLKKTPGVITYIESRKPFTAVMKAASFLIWEGYFSTIRDLMLDNMAWMVSDATCPLPKHARAKGWEHVPYGRFHGLEPAFDERAAAEQMVDLWASKPYRRLPMRWGYFDSDRHRHLLVTRKKGSGKSAPLDPPIPEPLDKPDKPKPVKAKPVKAK